MAKKSSKRVTTKRTSRKGGSNTTQTVYEMPVMNAGYGGLDPFFNPQSFDNVGNFRTSTAFYGNQDDGLTIDSTTRRRLVALSERIFATMGEATAASKLKASWVVTGGFDPVFNGANKDWATTYAYPFLKRWYSTCTNKGIAFDFKQCLKVLSRTLDRIGDGGMQVYTTKNGWPKINLIDGTNIGQRSSDGATITNGKYAGYTSCDGVIVTDTGTPVAYNVFGDDAKDDTVFPATQLTLIMEPDFFGLNRGMPIIFSSLTDAYNLQETVFYLSQLVKRHAMMQIVETNREGKAPVGKTVSLADLNGRKNQPAQSAENVKVIPRPFEWTVHGTKYLKAGAGERVETFESNMPALETQQFIERMEKRVLQAIGIPHEILLSPGSVGGASTRGVAEMVRKTITERQELLEKYAKIAIIYAINSAITNDIIPAPTDDKGNTQDFTDWSFTRGPELVLDEGNTRDADRKDYLLGLISAEDIARKNGQSISDVRTRNFTEAKDLVAQAKQLYAETPELDLAYWIQFVRQSSPNPIAPIVDTPKDDGDDNAAGAVVKKT